MVEVRGELKRLQSQINQQNTQLQSIRNLTVQHSQNYHTTVGAINSRLQVGTTPGNPALVNQWNVAQASLAQVENDIAQMNTLANGVASTSTLSAFLLETTRAAYGLSGAIDEDHRQLSILEDEVNRTVVLIDRAAERAERGHLAAKQLSQHGTHQPDDPGAGHQKRRNTGFEPGQPRISSAAPAASSGSRIVAPASAGTRPSAGGDPFRPN